MLNFPPHHLFLDAFLAAVLWTILTLTPSFFIQAPISRLCPLSHLSPRILGLPLTVLILIAAAAIAPHFSPIPQPDSVKVTAEIGGRISSIHVWKGDFVHTGDILIQLDTRDLVLKKKSLESRIHFTELQPFRNGLDALYRDLEETNVDLTRHTITSPSDGQVISLAPLRANDVLQPGASIAKIALNKV